MYTYFPTGDGRKRSGPIAIFDWCLLGSLSYRYTYRPHNVPYVFQANAGLYYKDLVDESYFKGTNPLSLHGKITYRSETLFDVRIGRRLMRHVDDRSEVYLFAGVVYRWGGGRKTYFLPGGFHASGYEALQVTRSINSFGGLVGVEYRWPISKWLSLHPSASYQAFVHKPHSQVQVGLHVGVSF